MHHACVLNRRACLGWLAAAAMPAVAAAAPGPMLAREAPPGLHPAGWLVSEKYDGVRALWDGQTLRFRSGAAIAAPASFLARLPAQPLDGELWLGRGLFEPLAGLVRRKTPLPDDWAALRYMVFDLPAAGGPFAQRAARLQALARQWAWPHCQAAPQDILPGRQALAQRLAAVVEAGGEGLVLHRADAAWHPGRSDALLKLKPLHDAEAVVTGHVPGRGQHAGRLGALQVRGEGGAVFLLGTGFSHAQREQPPAPGTVVTYTHRGHTAGGVPRFASFLRVHST